MKTHDILKRFAVALSIALVCLSMTACIKTDHHHKGTLDGPQANNLIAKWGKQLHILDVRTPEEYAQCHLKGAINIPVETLSEKVSSLPDGPILIVCRRGVRAHKAYHIILDAQPQRKELYYLNGTPTYNEDGSCNCMTFK